MENDCKILNGKIIYPWKSALLQIAVMSIGTFSTIYLAREFNYPIIGYIGLVVFFIVPAVYNKPIKDRFTKEVSIAFDENKFSLEVLNSESGKIERRVSYAYADIKQCRLSIPQEKYSSTELFFYNGTNVRYTFLNSDDGENLSEMFYQYILSASEKNTVNNKITLSPSFYNTKTGTFFILFLSIAIAGVFVFQVLYSKKTLPVSLLATLGLFSIIIMRRKRDRQNFEKLNK